MDDALWLSTVFLTGEKTVYSYIRTLPPSLFAACRYLGQASACGGLKPACPAAGLKFRSCRSLPHQNELNLAVMDPTGYHAHVVTHVGCNLRVEDRDFPLFALSRRAGAEMLRVLKGIGARR